MNRIKRMIDFINEQFSDIDPYGEEKWGVSNNFRSFEEGEDFDVWLVEIGVPENDINEIHRRFDIYKRLKKRGFPSKSEYLFSDIMPFIRQMGYNLDLMDADMDEFVGTFLFGKNKF